MDVTKLENKAKPMKKRSVQLVHEHFEEVFNAVIWLRSIRAMVSTLSPIYTRANPHRCIYYGKNNK